MSTYIKCGHCDGTGICERKKDPAGGPGKFSCDTCYQADGGMSRHGYFVAKVKWSICGGKGWLNSE